jgi:hypothetical protein
MDVARFNYSADLPARAVAIARVAARPSRPADLVDINSTAWEPGSLVATPKPAGAAVDASALGHTVVLSGAAQYLLANQFAEITDEIDADGNPFYYRHPLPSDRIDKVSITDLVGNPVTSGYAVRGGAVLHSFDGAPYWVSYYESQVRRTRLLQYRPVLERGTKAEGRMYLRTPGGLLTVPDQDKSYRLRFTEMNGYTVLPPYTAPPNDPWYARIRFNLRPVPFEWAGQAFLPRRPYMLATWVPGKVLARNLIEFERKNIWFDPLTGQYPDILVYDRDYQVKHALDGVPPRLDRPMDKGFLFPWRTSRIVDIDPLHGRVQVNVDLETDDAVFGFYSYAEPDIVYRAIDLNPFSNPAVKDKVVFFYQKSQSEADPVRSIWYEIQDEAGNVEVTNDPAPASGTKNYFGSVAVGFSVGTDEIALEDIRVRGGGLAPEYRSIPEAAHFWDTGNLDGKPYPLGGTLVVHLPLAVLDRFTAAQVKAKVESLVPVGTLPVIRYYDAAGEEYPE